MFDDIYDQVLSIKEHEDESESIRSTIYQRKIWYKLNRQRKYLVVKQIIGIFLVKLAVLLADVYLVQKMKDVFYNQMTDILELRKGIQIVVVNSATSLICATSILDQILIEKNIFLDRNY